MAEKEKKFITGMRYDAPSERAPSWIKGKISVNIAQFIPFAEANADARGWMNIDIKESKGGKLYLELNDYKKPEGGQQKSDTPTLTPGYWQPKAPEEAGGFHHAITDVAVGEEVEPDIKPEDLPF